MEHKKYMDIERLKDKYVGGFNKGDKIVIQEKIDGANASFQYDKDSETIIAYSRKTELNQSNNLRGFWEWTQKLDKNLYSDGTHLRFFGEWLVQHSVKYPSECYQKFYLFDIWDNTKEEYLPQYIVEAVSAYLGLIYVPTFYIGEFISWEHTLTFVGKTELGGDYGEGIVVKNMTRLNDSNTRLPFYTKIVSNEFSETKKIKQKTVDVNREAYLELTQSIVTKPRVNKTLHKMVDENIIPIDWDETNMSDIARSIGRLVYEDCIKEESETVNKIENFGKMCSSTCMKLVKEIMVDKDKM